jgi:hypothetical protein
LLLVFLSACAGSREAADLDEEADDLPVPAVNLSEYEDFDPSAYEDGDLGPAGLLEHDVPARLMEGRADEGIRTEVQGFRVQVHSSLDKNAAVNVEEDAREWLSAGSSPAPPGLSSGEPPIYVVYMQPYYRVRVGNFASRQGAERARQYLSQRFPEAFIVPDSVVITR